MSNAVPGGSVTIPFPWFDRISANARVKGFVAGVTALVVAWRFKIPEPVLIAAGAAAGLAISALR